VIPLRTIKPWVILVIPLLSGAHILADNVMLAWDPAPVPNLAGYNLYYGTVSGAYAQKIEIGNSTSVSVPNLSEGWTYFFAVTAYNALGTESPPSNEISFTVPSPTHAASSAQREHHNQNSNRGDEEQLDQQRQQRHQWPRFLHPATSPGLTPRTTRLLNHIDEIDQRHSLHGGSIEAAAYARWCRGL
jgi:Fibronectin type III domain